MIPMAIGTGEGSEMWKSLGITVAWGLSISTVVTLILIPTIYCVFATREEENKQKKLAKKGCRAEGSGVNAAGRRDSHVCNSPGKINEIMKAIFIAYNQAYNEEIVEVLDAHARKGFYPLAGH